LGTICSALHLLGCNESLVDQRRYGCLTPWEVEPSTYGHRHLGRPRLERAIGVIYRPETELQSHYFQAVLPRQFDE